MTPTAPELLIGCMTALATPPNPEEVGAFMVSKVRVAATINVLVAQECASGAAVRVWENAVLRAVLIEAASIYDRRLDGALGSAVVMSDGDHSLAALDAANAELRRRLIQLHIEVENACDTVLDRRILALYREIAARRELQLPTAPA